MTIERTRDIFGTAMIEWSDEQVLKFINSLGMVADGLINQAISDLTNDKANSDTGGAKSV